ncbi:hypothetical protein BDR07DRAFT_1466447, partial [Suillus spraguei]
HKDLSLALRFHILQGLVLAVSYLHSKDVVHGDITGVCSRTIIFIWILTCSFTVEHTD